jgi:hypothetical protein
MNDSRQIDNLLRDAAERVRVERTMPAKVRRRIRMRRIGTAAISLSVVAGLIVGAVLATETWSPDPIPPSEERDGREIVVTREDPSLPEGCGVRQATEALLSFMEALSDGNLRALDRAFSREKIFQWVSIAAPHALTGEATADREAIMSYFESRVSQSESYRLTNVIVETEIRNSRSIAAVQVSFLATRRANDIEGAPAFRGYAQLDCPSADIYAMHAGTPHPTEAIENWCPAQRPTTGDAVVACARGTGGKKSIIFPVANAHSGEEAGGGGRLVKRGRCLYLRSSGSPELNFPIWPPGFYYEVNDGVVTVRDGIGTPVAQTGSLVEMAGGSYDGKGLPSWFENEWKPCAPASSYFVVSYIADDE